MCQMISITCVDVNERASHWCLSEMTPQADSILTSCVEVDVSNNNKTAMRILQKQLTTTTALAKLVIWKSQPVKETPQLIFFKRLESQINRIYI